MDLVNLCERAVEPSVYLLFLLPYVEPLIELQSPVNRSLNVACLAGYNTYRLR